MMRATIKAALQDLIKDGLVEQVDGNDHYRLTPKGRIMAEAFGGCEKCPHCIATRGDVIAPDDPAMTTNLPRGERPPKRKR